MARAVDLTTETSLPSFFALAKASVPHGTNPPGFARAKR